MATADTIRELQKHGQWKELDDPIEIVTRGWARKSTTSNIVLAATEKRLEELCQLPRRPTNICQLTANGQAAGEDMDISQAALEAINAAYTAVSPDSYKGNEDLFDLAGEADYVIEELNFVRDVLMELPDTV